MYTDPASFQEAAIYLMETKQKKTTGEDTAGDEIINYQSLYYFLIDGISKVIDNHKDADISAGKTHRKTVCDLKKLLYDTEELYLKQTDTYIIPFTKNIPLT